MFNDLPLATTAVAPILAYVLGSVPFAVIVSRLLGLADPRSYGSKNPGATNVLRSGNKLAALLTLLGDAMKGWLAVFLAARFQLDPTSVACVALAVFLGHLYPVFLGFKGGKGVATAAGVIFGLSPWLGAAALVAWVVVARVSHYSSLGALAAAVLASIGAWLVLGPGAPTLAVSLIGGLIFWRHRENIKRLLAGNESKIGNRKSA